LNHFARSKWYTRRRHGACDSLQIDHFVTTSERRPRASAANVGVPECRRVKSPFGPEHVAALVLASVAALDGAADSNSKRSFSACFHRVAEALLTLGDLAFRIRAAFRTVALAARNPPSVVPTVKTRPSHARYASRSGLQPHTLVTRNIGASPLRVLETSKVPRCHEHGSKKAMGTILLIILILLLIGALPAWPYSSGGGYPCQAEASD